MIKNLSLSPIEKAINHLLAQDECALESLENYVGKTAEFHISDWNFSLFIQVKNQQIQLYGDYQGQVDTCISGPLFSLVRTSLQGGDSEAAFANRISIKGDSDFGHVISHLMKNIHLDWEEQLAKCTNDTIASTLGHHFRKARREIKFSVKNFIESASEYAHEDAGIAVGGNEVNQFTQDVRDTRDAVDRLEARIRLLTKDKA